MSAEAVRLSQLKCGPGEALWAPMGVGSPEDDRGTGRARIPVDTMRARGISLGDPVLLEVCPTGPRPKATSRGGGAAEGAEAEGGASKGEEGAAEGGDGEPPAVGCGCGGVGECTGLLFLCVAWPWPAAYSGSGHIQFDDLVQLPRRAAVDNYPPLVKRVGGQRIVRDLHTGVITSFTRPLVKAERIEVVFTSESNQVPAPLLKVMLQHRPLHSGCLVQFVNESISFTVQTTAPSQMCVVVTASTTITIIVPKASPTVAEPVVVGGMEKAVALVREAVSLPLRFPEIFSSLNIHSPRGILLKGEPGVGKTLLVNFIAHEFGATLYTINGPELYSSFIGDSEKALKAVFDKALDTAHTSSASGSFTPCIIFIDEIDSLCPTRSLESGQESRVVTQLVSCMDTISNSADHVVVLAATNRPNAIDPALRRPGRFDRELEIPVPDTSEREKILSVHTRQMPLQRDVHLTEIAKDCVGYVGADLASLCREAAILAIKEAAKTSNPDPSVSASHFSAALKLVPPSTQRSTFVSDLDVVTWSDIGGLEDVKRELHEAIELPLLHPEVFTRFGISPAKGVLLHGPSGCAKTTLVKAAANSSKVSFLSISGAAIYSPYLGDAEQTVRETFKRARLGAPAILFFDEIDAIVGQRDTLGSHRDSVKERVLSTILNEMDGIEKLCGVLVVAATNRPDLLDKALLRAGRFDRHVAVPLPDEATRQAILRVHTRKMPLAPDITLNSFATASEGMSGAEIAALCREAAMESLRENINNATVTALHFTKVMERLNSKTAAPQIIPTKPLFSFVPPEKTISTTPPPQQNGTSN